MLKEEGIIELRRAPRTFRELHQKCKKCGHSYHDHFNPDDECWCGCKLIDINFGD